MRDSKGRYLKGHGEAGPGRPARPVEERYAEALRNAVSVEDIEEILKKVVLLAKSCDMAAAKLVLSYCLGTPCDMLTERRIAALEEGSK